MSNNPDAHSAAEKFLARAQRAKNDPRFKPQALSNTEGEERAYRRGFDQGMNAALRAIGLSSDTIRSLHYVQRGAEFREGLQKYPPWDATEKEKRDIAKALNTLIADANDTQNLG